MAVLRILLVDDQAEFLTSLANMLSDDSRVEIVGQARSGREALEANDRLKPDAVLLDLAMPDMNGLQTTRHLKERTSPPCVVIMTCHGSKEYQMAARMAGADGFIHKDDFYARFPSLIDWLMERCQPPPPDSETKDS